MWTALGWIFILGARLRHDKNMNTFTHCTHFLSDSDCYHAHQSKNSSDIGPCTIQNNVTLYVVQNDTGKHPTMFTWESKTQAHISSDRRLFIGDWARSHARYAVHGCSSHDHTPWISPIWSFEKVFQRTIQLSLRNGFYWITQFTIFQPPTCISPVVTMDFSLMSRQTIESSEWLRANRALVFRTNMDAVYVTLQRCKCRYGFGTKWAAKTWN